MARYSFLIHSGGSYTCRPPSNFQKTAKSAVSHLAGPYTVTMSHRSPYCHNLTWRPPRPATGLLKPTHPTGLLKFPEPTTGDLGVSDDTASASATTGRRAARRLRVSPKAGPGAAARLEAGNCGEGFACLFQVCAILSHQACADGSVFFRRQLLKAGLSESTYRVRPILDPSPSPNLRSFN